MPLPDDSLLLALRARDYDYYLALGLAPEATREGLAALVTFAQELAHIAEVVSEPLMGHMRLAWWREGLAELNAGNTPRAHPLLRAMADLFPAGHAAYRLLEEMIEARAADLDASLLRDHQAWMRYLDRTTGHLHRLMAIYLIGEAQTRALEPALRANALGYALVASARSIPRLSAKGKARYPYLTLMGDVPGPLILAITAWLHEASTQLSLAKLPKSLGPHRALRRIARYHIRKLQQAQADPYLARPWVPGVVVRVVAEGLFA